MTPSPAHFDATVVIVSKNRADELRRAVQSALAQRGTGIEVLVVDDGSTDGTAEMIRREFPMVVFHRSEQSVGLVVQRNRAANLAGGDVLFSIDDDAIFSTPEIVAQTLKDFDDPRIGAVAIPFVDKNQSEKINQSAPRGDGTYVTDSFRGTAYAVRRDVFLSLAGFSDDIVHQGEESDFAIRLLQHGYFVRLGRAEPIFHFESPKRNLQRMTVYGWRNTLLFTWRYVPFPYLTIRLAANVLSGCLRHIPRGETVWLASGFYKAFSMIIAGPLSRHKPVRRDIYRLFR
jgi:glycosyltransferase involved in cell wall biosynthesis